ncbi:hypothetical protein BD410DRAFT_829620 [Rickenella mellea]|uniref:Uncharacterized protein n=1 Tax=Rickenella mellea TaxID=50990 RepID=A0A4Y7Q137_9AGAM|nr:hypothetical protein BD410DRAFT_829620 [Rickenella mellea]
MFSTMTSTPTQTIRTLLPSRLPPPLPNIDDRFHPYETHHELSNYNNSERRGAPDACGWGQVWSCDSALNGLYSLIWKSKINHHTIASKDSTSEEGIQFVPPFNRTNASFVQTEKYRFEKKSNKTADRMYALFVICNAPTPTRSDDSILNIVKEQCGEQFAKMPRWFVHFHSYIFLRNAVLIIHTLRLRFHRASAECIPAFEKLFFYASPKLFDAIPPPFV